MRTSDPHSSPAHRQILITGAARGIGHALAEALARDVRLVLTVRRSEDVEHLQREFPGARVLLLDLADTATIAQHCAGVGEVQGLVHCAGVESVVSAADLDAARLAPVLATNLAGPVELTRVMLPGLRRSGGHVVFVSSTAVLQTIPGWGAYAASKAALRAYADTLRVEEPRLRVTSVFPGRTDTGMQRRVHAQRGLDFDPQTAMSPASVASAVRSVLLAPDDVEVPELTVNPARRQPSA